MIKSILYLLLVLVLPVAIQAQVFFPKTDHPVQSLAEYLLVAEDKDNELSIPEIMTDSNIVFKSLSSVGALDPKTTWWMKLVLHPTFSSDSFFIGLPRQNLSGISKGNDNADVWIMSGDRIIAQYETGNLVPLSKKPVKNPINHNLFPVSLKKDQPITVYWRLARTVNMEPLQFNFTLQHASIVGIANYPIDKLAMFYTGVMLIMFLFGLVFYIITREKPFIWFTIIAAMHCLHMQLLHPGNPMTRWLFPENPIYQFHMFTILTSGGVILQLQFIRSFVHLKKLLPKWDIGMLVIMAGTALLGIISLALLEISPTRNLPEQLSLLLFLSIIIITIRLITLKDIYAKITGVAMLWLFVFQTLGILWNNDVIPAWFPNPWPIAQIGMMVILFIALAYRFKHSAKEKAEAAKFVEMDNIKSRFFANISHEFRTPLTLMLGPLKQMEENNMEPGQQKKYTRIMRRNGERLLQLINQLLDLSKLESGKMELSVEKTDITGLLKAIGNSFESLAEEKQINYHLHFPEENMVGFVDKDKLEKIVVNLLSNAFRFTAPNGTVSFSVENDGKRLRFTVQDNGVGMPKEQLNKIFDRFHQVAGTEGGTGIGLSLAKELLQVHKGQISVQSETGRGSSFRVSIPIAAESYDKPRVNPSASSTVVPAYFTGNGSSLESEEEIINDPALPLVLIAEDNKDLQQFIADILRNHFQVQVAANGKIAWQLATEQVPDCIVTDVMMPEMDGIEFCKRIKEEPATSHIPVIMLTAKAGSSSRMEGLQTGADDYLVKPFDGPELVIRIQNLIDQRRQLRERYSKQVISLQPAEINAPSVEQEFIEKVKYYTESKVNA